MRRGLATMAWQTRSAASSGDNPGTWRNDAVGALMRVRTSAMYTVLTVTPSARTSGAMLRSQTSKAPFEAWYAPHLGPGAMRAPQLMQSAVRPAKLPP